MNPLLLKRISANTAAFSSVPVLVGSGLALSLAFTAPPSEHDQFLLRDAHSYPAALMRMASDESVIRSQWAEVLLRAEDDDVERQFAPFVPPLRTRQATIHLIGRGRGLPIG